MNSIHSQEYENHPVILFFKGSQSGNIILSGRGAGNEITQLSYPYDLKFEWQGCEKITIN